MFTWKEEQMNKPVRIWLENIEEVEDGCLEQARYLAQLPFIHKWACLMPDTHQVKRDADRRSHCHGRRYHSKRGRR